MENKFTPELIGKAKSVKTEAELLTLAKENGIELTEEQAKAYFKQLHKSGELSDNELDNVAGGGCQTSMNGKNYTIVTSGLVCFTGKYENNYKDMLIGHGWFFNDSHSALRKVWADSISGDSQCGTCRYLEFKGGLGYCSVSGKE